ncbi:hypothetical protein [Deferrisoma sp.]
MSRIASRVWIAAVGVLAAGCAASPPTAWEPTAGTDPIRPCCALETPNAHHLPRLRPEEVDRRYRFRVEPDRPLRAGEPVVLRVYVEAADEPRPEAMAPYRERRVHALLVPESLVDVAHLHPQGEPGWLETAVFDGRHDFRFTPSHGGRYDLVLDFVDEGIWVTKVIPLTVEGPAAPPAKPDRSHTRKAGDLGVDLVLTPPEPVAKGYVSAYLRVTRNGEAVTDLEPFAGALLHGAQIGPGGEILHFHGGSDAFGHFRFFRDPPGYRGPKLYFTPQFDRPGRYRLVAFFRRAGREHRVAFDVDVAPPSSGFR